MNSATFPEQSTAHEDPVLLNLLALSACAMRLRAAREQDLARARLRYVQLGTVNLVHYQAIGLHTAERTRAHILEDGAQFFFVCIPFDARYAIQYRGRKEDVPPQSFVLLSSDTPFITHQCGRERESQFAAAFVRLPAAPLRARIPSIDEMCGRSIPMAAGMARAIRSTVDWALNLPPLDEQSGRSIGAGVFAMISDYAQQQIAGSRAQSPRRGSSLERTFERAKAFVTENLSNPGLTSADVAGHCKVSVRYLQLAFATHGESLGHHIRECRLQECRRSLREQSLSHRRVIEIATSWGFTDPCYFSRAYKSRFGIAPSFDRWRASDVTTPPRQGSCGSVSTFGREANLNLPTIG